MIRHLSFSSDADLNDHFLCGSEVDHTMSLRHPKDCVGFDTFRWYADNSEKSSIQSMIDWRRRAEKPTYTPHIPRNKYDQVQVHAADNESSRAGLSVQILMVTLTVLSTVNLL